MIRWIVVTRAAVLPMTLTAGLVAALLAVGEPGFDWRWLTLAIIGITLAHLANNLLNDLVRVRLRTPPARLSDHPGAWPGNLRCDSVSEDGHRG